MSRVVALAVAVVAALCAAVVVHATPATAPVTSPRAATSAGTATAAAAAASTRAETPAPSGDEPLVQPQGDGAAAPVRLEIPSLGIDSGLDPLRTGRDGELQAPRQWQRPGWFAEGTQPGDVGPAVVAGHVDSPSGPAVFAHLSEIRPGDRITVRRADGTSVVFAVDHTQVAAKRSFPSRAVYGPTPDAQLRLITCDGPFVESSGGYQDNLVVYATKVPA